MSSPLLATKLYRPPLRPQSIPRPRLVAVLEAGLHRRLTLVSAAAGFGKTTLVTEWVAGSERPVAWLSLDEADGEPTRFLAYLIAALQTIVPDLGASLTGVLQSAQPPPVESVVAALINEITAVSTPFILVLDDYHRFEAPAVDSALAFLLDHQPPHMHLVIATREDPPLPLARLRARGQLTELRAADLRFNHDEAAGFLNRLMGLDLSPAEIDALEIRTEGWIAGLQLAALSMQGRADTAAFIQAFAGDHRFVLDYLFEEVLQRQPPRVRRFLLETSLLDQLTGSLCDAVTGLEGGKSMLETLERGNLFVISLDDRRHWYRYHHLFADVLQAHLLAEQPDGVAALHRRAGDWYDQNGFPSEAIRHLLAGQAFEQAARLIELQVRPYGRTADEATWLGWIAALPPEMLRARPVLSVHYALASLPGVLDSTELYLRDAERWLDAIAAGEDTTGMIVADEEEFRSLPGTIAVARAYRAGVLGDMPAVMRSARLALDLLPAGDYLWRGAAPVLLGLAHWTTGDLETAHRLVLEGMASLEKFGSDSSLIGSYYLLAGIRMAQGRLRDAERTCHQGLQLAAQQGKTIIQGTADLHVLLAELHLERGDLQAAAGHLEQSEELGELAGLLESRHRGPVVMARLKEAQGDFDGALDLLDEAQRRFLGGPAPEVQPVAALRAQVWIKQGRLAEAWAWARREGLSAGDDLSYLREFEHVTLARLLFAGPLRDGSTPISQDVLDLLDRLLLAAEEGDRRGSTIAILLLLALAREAQDDLPAALAALERALSLAAPEQFVQVFVSAGPPAARLLAAVVARGVAPDYARQLLAAFPAADAVETAVSPDQSTLADPLSDRELDVLRLLATQLSGPDIAHELMVSLNTMRTHTKSIYSKLGVNNRRSAVARAGELHLL